MRVVTHHPLLCGVCVCVCACVPRTTPGHSLGPSTLPNLTELDASAMYLTGMGSGTLAALPGLLIADFEDNMLLALPRGLFAKQTRMFRLVLRANKIRDIPRGLFAACAQLMYLDLASNQLASLAGVLAAAPPGSSGPSAPSALYGVDLSGNALTAVAAGDLAGLGALAQLDLSGNTITAVAPGAFGDRGAGNLTFLGLNGNLLGTGRGTQSLAAVLALLAAAAPALATIELNSARSNAAAAAASRDGGVGGAGTRPRRARVVDGAAAKWPRHRLPGLPAPPVPPRAPGGRLGALHELDLAGNALASVPVSTKKQENDENENGWLPWSRPFHHTHARHGPSARAVKRAAPARPPSDG